MPCPQCGAPVAEKETRCSHCGAPIPLRQAAAMQRGPAGIPFDRFGSSIYGPPIAPDPQAQAPDPIDQLPPPHRFIGYRPIVPPPPLPMRHRNGRRILSLLGLALLILAGLIIAVLVFHVGAGAHLGPIEL